MDITLLKTFLEVSATGSFGAAADHLLVTQSAVSLRIQRLEDQLGRPLFTRSKAGAELTSAGKAFEHYALNLVKLWEDARQHVAIPEGFERTLSIGAQYSLWPRLGFRWIDKIQAQAPSLSISGELGMPDRLTRFLSEGILQCALMYAPNMRPGLEARQVLQDELVLVASWPNPTLKMEGRYILVNWGPEFLRAHAIGLPGLRNTGLTLSLGALTAEYILRRKAAAYLPARFVQNLIAEGRLHLVPEAPRFPYPIWVVWRDDTDPIVRAAADSALDKTILEISETQEEVLEQLADLNEDHQLSILGEVQTEHPITNT